MSAPSGELRPAPTPPPVRWASPRGVAPQRTLALILVSTLFGGTIAVGHRPGFGLSITALALVAIVALGRSDQAPDRAYDRFDRVLLGLAAALCLIATLRDSPWLVVLCLLAAGALTAFVAVQGRAWAAAVLAPVAVGVAGIIGLPWVARRLAAMRTFSPHTRSWIKSAALTLALLVVLGGLLGSADAIFGSWIDAITPKVELGPETVGRFIAAGCFGALALGLAAAAATSTRWSDLALPGSHRPMREWLLPVLVTDGLLAAFLALQAARLFPGVVAEVAPGDGMGTLAEQAHEGFGQLVAVTVIVVGLLAWAGSRCRPLPAERRWLAAAGGVLVGLGLLVVVSALVRLLRYEAEYGWTVMRLVAGIIELWLAVVLVLVALAWRPPVARELPRLIIASASVVLLGTALLGPDAVVARADVQRFEDTGKIDADYLSTLSADAWPGLATLPPEVRACALPSATGPLWDGIWAANVARARADAVREELFTVPVCDVPTG